MKRTLCSFILTLFFIACNENNDALNEGEKLADDYYMGSYRYHGIDYWSEIIISDHTYNERPSGGYYYQKPYNCLTAGTYSVHGNKLTFVSDPYPFEDILEPCDPDVLLTGEYQINCISNDSLIFERGTGNDRIVYYLERLFVDIALDKTY